MKNTIRLMSMILIAGLSLAIFQNCGPQASKGEITNSLQDLDSPSQTGFGEAPDDFYEAEPLIAGENEFQTSAALSERERIGSMGSATLSGNDVIMSYNRGVRSKYLSSDEYVYRYYRKAIFFVNGEYFGYANNAGSAFSKGTRSTLPLNPGSIDFLKKFNASTVKVQMATYTVNGPTSRSNEVTMDISELVGSGASPAPAPAPAGQPDTLRSPSLIGVEKVGTDQVRLTFEVFGANKINIESSQKYITTVNLDSSSGRHTWTMPISNITSKDPGSEAKRITILSISGDTFSADSNRVMFTP